MGDTTMHQTGSQISRNNSVARLRIDNFHTVKTDKLAMFTISRNPLLRTKFTYKCFAADSITARSVLGHLANTSGVTLVSSSPTVNILLGLLFSPCRLNSVYANSRGFVMNTTHKSNSIKNLAVSFRGVYIHMALFFDRGKGFIYSASFLLCIDCVSFNCKLNWISIFISYLS